MKIYIYSFSDLNVSNGVFGVRFRECRTSQSDPKRAITSDSFRAYASNWTQCPWLPKSLLTNIEAMRIVWLSIEHFRSIRKATLCPDKHNIFLGPNNAGKTTILEALNLLLNPETGSRGQVIDENDFYRRRYRVGAPVETAAPRPEAASGGVVAVDEIIDSPATEGADVEGVTEVAPMVVEPDPIIRIQAVLVDLTDDDLDVFPVGVLVPWDENTRQVVESTEEGVDPFANATRAVRLCFEGWYDTDEDAFDWKTYFRGDPVTPREHCTPFTRVHKRRIGFLIYRDFRALQRAITLEPYTLFGRLLESQNATPKHFEGVLSELEALVVHCSGSQSLQG